MSVLDFIKHLRASTRPEAPGADAPQHAPAAGPVVKTRRRLFTKYVALFVAVVCVALVSNGVFDVLFYYQEHKASLIRIQREQAEAAAAKIGQFIKEIESQLGWTTQLPWSAGSIEQRRFDALRLLRQVPAITELAQLDATGKERLRVSRLAMDVGASASGGAGTGDNPSQTVQEAENIEGRKVLTAYAPVAPLGWLMFVELPAEEAYAPLYAALQRLAFVLLGALGFAVLAGMFLAG